MGFEIRFRVLVIPAVMLFAPVWIFGQTTIFADNMDSFPNSWNRWSNDGVYWTKVSSRRHTDEWSAKCDGYDDTTGPDGQHPGTVYPRGCDNGMSHAALPPIIHNGMLSFWCWCHTQPGPYDYVVLELRDHNSGNWTEVWRRSGVYRHWDSISVVVPDQSDSLRFRFHSDPDELVYEGVYIDDVVLMGFQADVGVIAIVRPSGTVDSGLPVQPACAVLNSGNMPVNYRVKCWIGGVLWDSADVWDHEVGRIEDIPFSVWTPVRRGSEVIRCSTMLSGDVNPENDAFQDSFEVGVRDVACLGIVAPPGLLDSGYPVTPQVLVANQGSAAENFNVTFGIGSFYADTQQVVNLPPGESSIVTFTSRAVTGSRGTYPCRCSVALDDDLDPGNDQASSSVTIGVHDVGTDTVLSPGTTIDSGTVVVPKARLHNFGTRAEDFVGVFRIDNLYSDTQSVTGLGPGRVDTLSFRPWSARSGSHAWVCSTVCATDLVEGNNRRSIQVFGRYTDGALTRILSPNSPIDTGRVTPRIEISNQGNAIIPVFPVTCSINSSPIYRNTQYLYNLAPGTCTTRIFLQWPARLGIYQAVFWHTVSGDMNRGNDTLRKSVVVDRAHHDVGVTSFASPPAQIDPGAESTRVKVFNYGSTTENNVRVNLIIAGAGDVAGRPAGAPGDYGLPRNDETRMTNHEATGGGGGSRLGVSVFTDSQTLASVDPGEEKLVVFRPWAATSGSYVLKAWTGLTGDEQRGNDTARFNLLVARHNVGALRILVPVETIGIGYPIRPHVRVDNRGTVTDSFPVFALITGDSGPVSCDSTSVTTEPGDSTDAVLSNWTPTSEGGYQIAAWTRLASDVNPADDSVRGAFVVADAVVDAAARQVISPGDTVVAGLVIPEVLVGNPGNVAISFWAILEIAGAGDQESGAGSEGRGARLQDFSPHTLQPSSLVYHDSVWIGALNPAETRTAGLPVWHAVGGRFRAVLRVSCQGDGNPHNDSVAGSVFVNTVGLWSRCTPVPAGAKNKNVKGGGALAAVDQFDSSAIYCFKGNNRCEFYGYNLAKGLWTTRESIPAVGRSGKKKMVNKGAAMCAAGGLIYAVKGNNTTEFWRYTPTGSMTPKADVRTPNSSVIRHPSSSFAYPWTQMADVPVGAKNIKEGAGLVAVPVGDTIWVYLLKGSGTEEFYRYNTLSNVWQTRVGAPAGTSGKPYKNGSCVTSDGSFVYALKAGYDEFYAYRPDSNLWATRAALPFVGWAHHKKKAKDGAALAYVQVESSKLHAESSGASGFQPSAFNSTGFVYALKGNNTLEFWCYRADSWSQGPDVPMGAGKRVKGGGALVAAAGDLYALKGNNTLEFWRFDAPSVAGATNDESRTSNALSFPEVRTVAFALSTSPNPFTSATTIRYTLRRPASCRLSLYDVAGKLVALLARGLQPAGVSEYRLQASGFPRGIYVVQLETESGRLSQKLIIE